LFLYTCNEKTARPEPGAGRVSCETFAEIPQARVSGVLEDGDNLGLDYALLSIEWSSVVPAPVGVKIPRPGRKLSSELLVIAHPAGQPTQASAGKLLIEQGPHPDPSSEEYSKSREYSYANFHSEDGSSGGGVFNENSEIVGVLAGGRKLRSPDREIGFVNLWAVVWRSTDSGIASRRFRRSASERLQKWFGGGPPLLAGDPGP